MPLLPTPTAEILHVVEEVEADRPAPTLPTPPPPAARSYAHPSTARMVFESTRSAWPVVVFHLLILGGTVGYAATATAEPTEAIGLTPEAVQAVAGDPWASVVVAVLFVGGQLISAWREASKVKASDLEKALALIEALRERNLLQAAEISELKARAELAQLREGDARAAVSGTPSRPPDLSAS